MNWLFGNQTKKNIPMHTNLQMQKTKQIETLNTISAIVTEIFRDIEYRVTFSIQAINYNLIIHLPPQFPQAKPTVSVEPVLRHPWVDNLMQVSLCPALLSFGMHSSLGAAIQSIIDEFRSNPPQLVPTNTSLSHSFGIQPQFVELSTPRSRANPLPYPISSTLTTASMGQPLVNDHSLFFYAMPHIPMSFPSLDIKTTTELNELMNDDEVLQKFLQELPEIKKISEDKQTVSKNCADLAKSNIAMKPQLESLKLQLHSDVTTLGSLQNTIDTDIIEYSELSQQYTLSTVLTNLKVAILEAEEESENIADTFLNNKTVIDEFCKTFMDKRTLCHSRRAKEEKLNQLMLSQGHRF